MTDGYITGLMARVAGPPETQRTVEDYKNLGKAWSEPVRAGEPMKQILEPSEAWVIGLSPIPSPAEMHAAADVGDPTPKRNPAPLPNPGPLGYLLGVRDEPKRKSKSGGGGLLSAFGIYTESKPRKRKGRVRGIKTLLGPKRQASRRKPARSYLSSGPRFFGGLFGQKRTTKDQREIDRRVTKELARRETAAAKAEAKLMRQSERENRKTAPSWFKAFRAEKQAEQKDEQARPPSEKRVDKAALERERTSVQSEVDALFSHKSTAELEHELFGGEVHVKAHERDGDHVKAYERSRPGAEALFGNPGRALKRGQLGPRPFPGAQMHHPDYNAPLAIKWVHAKGHSELSHKPEERGQDETPMTPEEDEAQYQAGLRRIEARQARLSARNPDPGFVERCIDRMRGRNPSAAEQSEEFHSEPRETLLVHGREHVVLGDITAINYRPPAGSQRGNTEWRHLTGDVGLPIFSHGPAPKLVADAETGKPEIYVGQSHQRFVPRLGLVA